MEWLGPDGLTDCCRIREGTYGAPGGVQVYFEDANTYRDVTDLYTLLENERGNGTPNLENAQVEQMAAAMYGGYPLTDIQIGALLKLLSKHKAALAELRSKPDREGQDYTDVPDPGTARIVGG